MPDRAPSAGGRGTTSTWSTSSPGTRDGQAHGDGPSGSTTVPQPRHTRASASSASIVGSDQPGPVVQLADQAVPHVDEGEEAVPERLLAPGVEHRQVDPLLLHPGEVAEVEHPV